MYISNKVFVIASGLQNIIDIYYGYLRVSYMTKYIELTYC